MYEKGAKSVLTCYGTYAKAVMAAFPELDLDLKLFKTPSIFLFFLLIIIF